MCSESPKWMLHETHVSLHVRWEHPWHLWNLKLWLPVLNMYVHFVVIFMYYVKCIELFADLFMWCAMTEQQLIVACCSAKCFWSAPNQLARQLIVPRQINWRVLHVVCCNRAMRQINLARQLIVPRQMNWRVLQPTAHTPKEEAATAEKTPHGPSFHSALG